MEDKLHIFLKLSPEINQRCDGLHVLLKQPHEGNIYFTKPKTGKFSSHIPKSQIHILALRQRFQFLS